MAPPAPSTSVAPPVTVVIGSSAHADDSELVEEVVRLINAAYHNSIKDLQTLPEGKHVRITALEVCSRFQASREMRNRPNRVLHLAFRQGKVVGCCSSTLQPPWTQAKCGHWGLLAVATAAQGTGVASELVRAAEQSLQLGGCTHVQIEYEYNSGHAYSQRLMDWYEVKLGFRSNSPWLVNRLIGLVIGRGGSEFRRCQRDLQRQS
ncbi:unnamed protein product [Polarella glacialis]|uniref:N-acetyltransferase domain-containing protein n=1 Tax=Polarella glacialis TaxID=89957 RepID=A0A813H3C7_POLGL|nr:unnamed protein product [Polarella glacialis]